MRGRGGRVSHRHRRESYNGASVTGLAENAQLITVKRNATAADVQAVLAQGRDEDAEHHCTFTFLLSERVLAYDGEVLHIMKEALLPGYEASEDAMANLTASFAKMAAP